MSDPKSDSNYTRIKASIVNGLKIKGNSIENFKATMVPENPSLGCNLSHSRATSEYPDRGYLCVMEDDIDIFEGFDPVVLDMEIPETEVSKLDAIYLGISSWGYFEESPSKARLNWILSETPVGLPNIFSRIRNMFSAHAIIYMNKDYAFSISDGVKKASLPNYIEPNDLTNARSQMSNFCVALKTPIFYQKGEHEYCTKIFLKDA